MSANTEKHTPLLQVIDLHTSFKTDKGEVKAVNGVTYTLEEGKSLGIVGESGSGKSVSAYSIMQILDGNGHITQGKVLFKGEDITKYTAKQMEDFRGRHCSMIFQDPMTSLNPVYTVGNQIMEAITTHHKVSKEEARKKAQEMLELVGINDAPRRLKQYPHELSGGMRQRVMIAMALVSEPSILIADEPTTALDVTIQAQILELMMELQKKLGMAIIIVTHDLGVIAQMSDEIVVMYGGRKKLIPIAGTPINLLNMPKGCAFCSRCDNAMKICLTQVPDEVRIDKTHLASCWINVRDNNYLHEEEAEVKA